MVAIKVHNKHKQNKQNTRKYANSHPTCVL